LRNKSSGSIGRVRVELDPELVGGSQVGGDGVAAVVAEDRALGAVAVNFNVVPVAVVDFPELLRSSKCIQLQWDNCLESLET